MQRRCHAFAAGILLSIMPITARAQKPSSAQHFVLDYDVPESPGFIALGVTPANITRGSASKPVVASLLSDLATRQKLASGIALDFAPYFLYGGRFQSVNEYRRNRLKRWLANSLLSIATVQSETDSSSLRFGLGARGTLFDNHDLLQDSTLGMDIDRALTSAAHAGRPRTDTSEVGAPVTVAGLADAYKAARERVRTKPGDALSVGWGIAGVIHGSVVSGDSIGGRRNRVWLSYRHTFRSGMDLLATAQWRQADSVGSSVRAGAGLRANVADANFAGELYYDSNPKGISGGKLGIGANAEWRFTRGVGLVVALSTVPTVVGSQVVSKMKVRTSLRWDMNGEN